MKILLVAINAKYIHSNLAVYSLRAYAAEAEPHRAGEVEIVEYTVNQTVDDILMDLYGKRPDVLCFSCYLWNIEYVRGLSAELSKILPRVEIWLGGPEVSYHAERILEGFPNVAGIMCGEGEETFLELLRFYHGEVEGLEAIAGLVYRERPESRGEIAVGGGPAGTEHVQCQVAGAGRGRCKSTASGGGIFSTGPRHLTDLSRVPFAYRDMDAFKNKIIYYESSRGCPFSCSYCLSSVDKELRFRDLDLVKRELQFFIDRKVPQVKFVDRTFNCRHDRAMEIWSYLKEHDQGHTNFHFEVAADLLDEEELGLICSMRPGLIQLEIGVQSTNERTVQEIRRSMFFPKVAEVVGRIRAAGNVHQHLDLIAGLPFEDHESFRKSFCDVYALRPQQLQLGFLKVLKGSPMEEKAAEYELRYQDRPPYEVLSTKWLSYADVIRLKRIEEMVEVYYNGGQFVHTMELLEREFSDAFSMYGALAEHYGEHGYFAVNHTRIARYEILFAFLEERLRTRGAAQAGGAVGDEAGGNVAGREAVVRPGLEKFRQALVYDLYLRENVKNRPAFAGEETVTKEEAAKVYEVEARERRHLAGYGRYDKRQLRKMTHLERINGELLLFDYQNRDTLTRQARVCRVDDAESV